MKNYILLITLMCFLQAKAKVTDVYFEQISPESGFTFNDITSITEDSNGLLWFTCNNRLYHNNTSYLEEYSLYNDSSSFSNPTIEYSVNQDENILLCTTAGLYHFNKENKIFHKIDIYFPDAKLASNAFISSITKVNDQQSIIVINGIGYILTEGNKVLSNLSKKNTITRITFVDFKDEKILIGTQRGRMYTMSSDLSEPQLLYNSEKSWIRTILKDGNKYLIGYHDAGIDIINLFGNYIESYNTEEQGANHIPNNMVRQIIKRDNGDIWIGTFKGIIIKGKHNMSIIDAESGRGLPHSSIYLLEEGQNGGVWAGTWAGGIAYYRACNYKFKNTKPLSKDGVAIGSAITAFTEDESGNIWIASERGGANLFKVPLEELESSPARESDLTSNDYFPKDIKYMHPNKLVIMDFVKGFVIYDMDKKTEKSLKDAFAEKNMRLKNTIENFTTLGDQIWVYGRELASYSEKEGITIYNMPKETPEDLKIKAWFLTFDSAQNLWICTTNGLYVKYKNSSTLIKCLKETPLENEVIYTCCEDKDGQIWIGTGGEGPFIYHPETDTVSQISKDFKMKGLDIYSIIRSEQNEMWLSTNKGVFLMDRDDNLTHYSEVDGLSGLQYKPNAGFICSNGQILFGALNGYNVITPSIIKVNETSPKVMLSEFLVNDKPLSSSNSKSTNTLDIYNLNKVSLKHSQNTINLTIISNNYLTPSKNKFKYRLINYNDEWTEIKNGKEVHYTKIPSGSYTFEAYGANNDGIWSDTPYQLSIKVLPTPWKQWYFILLYIISTITIGFIIFKNISSKIVLKKSIKDEKQRSHLNDAIHQERVKFFVNISHELRTPLSLILSPVRSLLTKYENDESTARLLKIVDRNSKRLLRLTDQTLDFRLLEMGKLKPQLRKTDVIQLAIDSYTFFEQRILEKEINFSFYSDFKFLQVLIDGDMIEKIIFNLVSNAIDFTPADGDVKLTVKKTKITEADYKDAIITGKQFVGSSIEITITDSGIGMETAIVPDLFKRFTKAGDDTSKTGIGLHLCSEYAALNDGNIMVTSTSGHGSSFILNLPIKDETEYINEKQKHIISHAANAEKEINNETKLIHYDTDDQDEDTKSDTILIVDSNKELLSYLKKYLNTSFRVTTAHNTTQAIKILNQLTPSIIITEISFPDEEDYTCIESIKSNKRFSDIPIIVLTQLTEKKHQIDCLRLGGDAFLSKPIEDAILLAQIKNLSKKKNKVQATPTDTRKPKSVNMNIFDGSTFTAVAEQIVVDNLQNMNFDANTLAEKMEVSYSTLFRRIKKETNISATQFIRDTRLNKSIELLEQSDLSIDEIGTSIGFNSTSYFVRSFKKKYSKTPSEFRKSR